MERSQKKKSINEKKEIRKNDVSTNNTFKEVVGRRNKEKKEKQRKRENFLSLKEEWKRKIFREMKKNVKNKGKH